MGCVHSKKNAPETDSPVLFSDYFVFISDDASHPLIIPIDFNWNITKEGYNVEFKSWYGTKKDWPIIYKKKNYKNSNLKIPKESFEHKNIEGFSFNTVKKEITVRVPYAPVFTLIIPEKDEWVLAPARSKTHKDTYASKTKIKIRGKMKTGWLLYEKIRWKKEEIREFGDFETFFWIPLIVEGALYHFEQHKDEKIGYKWIDNNGKTEVIEVADFNIKVTKTVADFKSGRKSIPKEIQVFSAKSNLDVILTSKGEQVGYGAKYPKGLGYYRQSLLVSNNKSEFPSFGMMELVIENN